MQYLWKKNIIGDNLTEKGYPIFEMDENKNNQICYLEIR